MQNIQIVVDEKYYPTSMLPNLPTSQKGFTTFYLMMI